jgi:hypothetical protein
MMQNEFYLSPPEMLCIVIMHSCFFCITFLAVKNVGAKRIDVAIPHLG